MAKLPTAAEAEQEVLKVFDKFGVRPNEVLMLRSLLSNWDHTRFRMQDLQDALQSLADAGAIYMKANGPAGSFFLTEKGYDLVPSRVPSKSANPAAPSSIHVSGSNARVNINSTDNSVNVIQINETVLNDVIATLAALPDQPGKEPALSAAQELKAHAGKSSFAEKYKDFMSSVSDHVSILLAIAPYLGPLAAMI